MVHFASQTDGVSLWFPKGTKKRVIFFFFLVAKIKQIEKQQLNLCSCSCYEEEINQKTLTHHSQHYYYNHYYSGFTFKYRHVRQATKAAGSVSLPPAHDFPPPSHCACATRCEVRKERQSQRKRRRVGGSGKPFYNWVTWKCQRWGASFFCATHTNTCFRTRRRKLTFPQTHSSSAQLSG